MTTLRQIVDASEPSEVVVVANAQLFALDASAPGAGPADADAGS
jgi:hypothetical protein